MAEIIKETVTQASTDANVVQTGPAAVKPIELETTSSQTASYIVYFIFGALEVLLAFRFVLKLLGASAVSDFVKFIYGFSGIFVAPFEGIFHSGVTSGIETTSVLEPATIIAILVYGLLAWGIVVLAKVISGKQQSM